MTPWALMWLPGLGLPLLLVTTAVGGPPGDSVLPASGDATLAFVFDVTGSMWDDLRQVVEGASRILERSLSGRSKAIANYALVPFHDPDIGPVTLTSDPAVFQRELRELYVQGGGDCPEMSIGAIKAAVEISNPSSFIYVFSDARAKDYHRKPELLRLLQLKQSQVVFVLTGDCGDRTHPGYLAYEEIAATSSGQVFHLDKQQVNEVLKWVEEAIQVSKVHLLSTDHEKEGEHTWKIPFDPSLKEVTISLSGPGPEIEVRDPLGRILQKDEGLNMLLNIPDSAKVVAFKPEHPGLWSIKVYSSGRHSVRITGISNINFRAGFTTQPSLDLNHTIEWPLQGVPISLVINSTGLLAPGRLDSVELSHSSGQPLLTLPAGSLSNTSSHQLWVGPPFRVPKERFYLKVKGEDHEGNPLHRVSNVAYNGVAPGSPLVTMPNKIHGYLWQPLLISCSVHSSLPFRLQLRRNGVKLGEERHFQESGNSTWEIPRASKSEEGVYECTAMSRAGTGKAKTQLVVTDPPPQLASPQNVTVSPGETALLSCQVLDKAPYNLTWVRDWRVLPASPGRVVQLANLSLEISGIIPSDGGKYQCLASNANGITRASVWLLIREPPQISINTSSRHFSQGVELRISCTASGYPPPHISWRHNDQTIGMDGRFLVDDQGTLIIQSVTPEDAGNYSCQATNEVGTDEQTVTLFYTEPPSVSALRPVVLAPIGEEAVLECKASGVPPPRVIWYRGGLEMILAPEVAHTGTLRIQEVQERDAGNYICKAVNELGAASADIRLEVGYAPQLVESSRNMVVEMGRNAILACRAEGRPSPRITWARVDGKPVPAHPVEGNRARQLEAGVLFLENVTPEDQALYICEAHNTFGKAQAEVQLTVIGHEPPQIASSASMVRVLEGQPASLPCVVLAGKPFPQRHWLKEGQAPLPSSRYSIRTDGSFHIDRALQEDAGRYSCVVTNTVGSQRQDIELAVQVLPSILPTASHYVTNEGVPISLPCVSRGIPTPTITWRKETNALSPRSSHHQVLKEGSLYLPQPSAQDSGTYVCTATNALGISSQEIQLSVNTKPRIIMNESLDSDRPVTITALAGKELTLHCEAEGSPSPLITWTKDSQLLSPITDRHSLLPSGSLKLAETSVEDNGLYTCIASNPAGTASRSYVLGVQVPPQIQQGPQLLKVLAGESLDLTCVATGDPKPQLRWSKDGITLPQKGWVGPDGSVHLESVQVSDSGHYHCVASSEAGEDARELELEVLEPPRWEAEDAEALLERVAGENASLPCPVTGTPTPRVIWRKDPAPELLSSQPGLSVLNDSSLFIASVSSQDSGDYECRATNEVGSVSRKVKLVVYVPPHFRGEEQRVNVSTLASRPLTLNCDVSGFPTPAITWYKDGRPVSEDNRHYFPDGAPSLHFPQVQKSDSDLYTCQAVNRAGMAQKDFNLLVLIPPSVRGAGTAQEVSRLAGLEVELECRTSGVPLPQVEWTKDGQPVAPGDPHIQLVEDGQVLKIPSSHLGDAGHYQCVAFSPAGQQAKDFQLSIQTPPTIWGSNETGEVAVMEDHVVRLQCDARGVPTPAITWLKDGDPLHASPRVAYAKGGRHLQLGRARGSDSGLYTCQASNAAGIAEKAVRLDVYVPPTIEGADGGPLVVKAVAGRPLALGCSASGHPPPTLTWHQDENPLTENNGTWLQEGGRVLRLERVTEAASGHYSCLANSPAGETVLHYMVEVQVPPQLLVGEGSGQVTTVKGHSLELPCQATGSPTPIIQWLRNGRPAEEFAGVEVSTDGAMLRIDHVQPDHNGLFACQATNEAGTAGAEVEVLVHEQPSVTVLEGENITAPFLQPVTIQCVAAGMPVPNLSWWKNGVSLVTTGGSLQIEKVDLRDEGNYTCVATNLAGEAKRDVVLKVLVPPNIEPGLVNKAVLENTSASLECLASGVPTPRISWYRGRQPISSKPGLMVSSDGRVLRIKRAQLSDAGSYRCVASNVAGSSELKFGLRINVPPRITLAPSLPGPVLLNEPVRLVCNATGAPSPMLMWLKDGNPVSATGTSGLQIFPGGHVLTLAGSRATDAGTYTCVAVNAVGEDRRDVTLQVHLPPSILGEEQNVSVVVNQSVTLECQSQAVPPPVLSWRKDGHTLSPRPGVHLSADGVLLQVERAEVQDVGRYTCEALNKAGRSEKHYNLNVWVPPEFSFWEPRTLAVTEGHPVSLSCECWGIPFPKITWKKDGMLVPTDGGSTEPISAVGRLLYLGKAQPSQEGNYTCECSNIAGNSSQEQHLEVYVAPKIPGSSDFHKEVSVIHSGEVTLECEATGKPPPVVTWEKDGQLVTRDQGLLLQHRGRALQVEQARAAHAGRYTCIAENEAGRAEQRFDLSVLVPPELTGDTDPLTNVTTVLQSTLTLLCEVSGNPSPLIRWFRGEEPISPGEEVYFLAGGRILKLTQVQEEEGGLYMCLASNIVGEVRKNFSVEVLVPPRIENEDTEEVVKVPEGQSAYLTCNVTGHPQPTVTWFKDGRTLSGGDLYSISPDGSLLEILQANFSSSGHYSCIASNSVSEKTKHYKLSVLVGPTILGATEDNPDEEVTVTINNPISLICEALAFPSPTVTWMKDGAPFQASGNTQLLPGTHGLQILNAQEQDAGRYTCVVTNEVGEAVKNYHVEVLIPPSISKDDPLDEFSVKEVKAKVNSTLSLECESWAMPPPTITWYKDGQLVSPDNRLHLLADGRLLQINPTKAWDSGRYLCVATNVAGEDDKDFNVLVQVPPIFQKIGDPNEAFEVHHQEEELRGGVLEYREIVENNPAYLYCDTNAVPPPQLTWYKDDQPLSDIEGISVLQGGRVLQIPMVRSEDAGRYTCKASNEVGEDWLHYELLVLTPPVIQGDPEELVEEVTVNANSTVNLQCQALGTPTPVISWLRNGLPFIPSSKHQALEDGQVLQVSVADAADSASYMCVAENSAGSSEKLFTLKVQAPPRITGLNPERITAIVNSSVSLPCDVHSHPSPEVTWYKDGWALPFSEDIFLLPGTHTLQLPRPKPSDTGTYTCEALNVAGRDQKLVLLSVFAPPTIKQTPGGQRDTTVVRVGDTAVLHCESDTLPEPVITWYKNGQQIALDQQVQTLLDGQKLEIVNVQVADKGLYSCKVSNIVGEAIRTFVLIVQVPPIFENPETETLSQVAGNPLVLVCDVAGVPAPTVTWLKDRMPVESSVERGVVSRGGRLQLSRLQPSQEGTYTCVAENPEAEARKDFVVMVLVAPRILSSGVPQEHNILEEQEVRLECEAEGQPQPDISWLKDGRPLGVHTAPHLRFYTDGSSLVLKGLKSSDSGAYTCLAQNSVGEDTKLHTVSVLVPPTIERGANGSENLISVQGELVTMACPARGSPPIQINWLKDGLPMPLSQRTHLHSSGRTLRISQVQVADAGTFTCVASSPAGVAERTFSLQIHVPPVLEPSETKDAMAVVRGSDVTLPCEARGSPLPAVSWLKDGASLMLQRLGLGSGSSLQLEAVQADDAGTYSCVAINEAGEATRHFQLAVMEPPHIEDSGQAEEMLLLPGAPLELICNALGSPMPNITWQKDGQVLARLGSITKDGRVLRVEGVQVDDAGLYTCLAENPAGEDGKNFLVRVQAPPNIVGSRETRTVIGLADGQLVLECPVEADPPPKIEWHREGVLLQADAHTLFLENGRFLQLQALDTSDSGDYNCVASNAAGSTSLPFSVEIHMAPTIQPGPSVVNVSVNETALLPCKTRGLPVSLVSWRKDGIPLVPGSPRLEFLSDGSLRIQPVYPQDSGYYLCQASNSAGSDRQGRELRVFEPPTIAPGPSNLTLTVHTQATLPCEARGSPKPHVVWKKNGQTLSLDRHQEAYRLLPSSSLVLTDPDLQDTAQFECLVSNDAGETRRLFWVTVYVPPTIADDRTDFTVTKMAPVVLTCHTTGVPTPVVSWSKGGAQLGKRGSGYRVSPTGALEIEQALPIHTGRYTCTARNAAGVAHKHVILMVQASPVINPLPSVVHVMALDDVVLPCEASGIPRPTITWQKEGLSIPTGTGAQILSSGQLRISRASAEDAGNYLCIAKNPSGTALGKTRLVVQVPPVIKGGHSDLSAAEGSQALLPCIAQGIPEPHITWKKDGFVVPSMEGKYTIQPSGELLVKNSERRDAGTYTCIAENAAGHTSRRVHLSILSLPTFTTLPGDLSLNHGDRLWLRCTARGSPTPHISWMVNNRLVKEGVLEQDGGSTLQRAAVTREDSGTYTCWAENIVGKVQAVSFVHVKEAPALQGEASSHLVELLGDSARLDCAARGDPAPVIRWIKDGLPVLSSHHKHQLQNGSLAIHRTVMEDAGSYHCLAENEVGVVEKVVTLILRSAPIFVVEPQDVVVRAGGTVVLLCQAAGEPVPTVEWTHDGHPIRVNQRLRTLPNGSLQFKGVEMDDMGEYECVAHNLLGTATAHAFVAVKGDPRGSRGRMIGEINGQEFGVAYLNTSVLQEDDNGATTIQSSINNIPPEVGPLMRILVVAIAPIYWVLAGQSGEVLNGYSLTKGNFRQESQVEFATGELLHLTQVARGLDRDGLLLLDVVVNGFIPEALALAQLQVQDFQERYVQIGPGQLYVGSTQTFLKDGAPTHFRCNHTIQYDSVLGPQPQLVQHLRATEVSSAFDPGEEALRFQLTTALQADENEADCPEGFVLDSLQAFCTDKDECSSSKSPCSHTCHNSLGRFSCSCPSGYALAWDNRNCKDVDECAWDTSVCHDGQRCVNLLGSYQCLPHCRTGFQATADGTGCEDVNECLEHLDECRYNQICENILGGHRCTCPPGYRSQGHGHPCLDINECLQLPKICAYQCHNLQGSYRCLCPPGQALLQDGKACGRLEKIESNVTTISYQGSFPSWLRPRARAHGGSYHAWISFWPIGSPLSSAGRTWCPPGFTRRNGACTDLDECQVRTLCQHACRNTEGSYQCLCPAGYRLLSSGKNCQDINECVEEGIKCGPSQMCFNTRGSYQCVDTPCPATYRRGSSPGMCFRRCALDCSSGGPFTLQYKLLTLPFGIRADHDVVRLTAFSDGGVLPNRTVLTVLEPDPNSPFALREPQSGQGAIYTRRPLTDAGVYRLKVQAVTYGEHRILRLDPLGYGQR
ncbi:hemicentin-2 isoform X2 [Monodelphis domestica]|uniref:hemicentin-2 isoform X2 n=1 Tax=Monodelphis domestica TaxID=13616 RepID=UPI0024E1A68F|nr:hemicentin-2 isoform X2 [Monodelphis domestica]